MSFCQQTQMIFLICICPSTTFSTVYANIYWFDHRGIKIKPVFKSYTNQKVCKHFPPSFIYTVHVDLLCWFCFLCYQGVYTYFVVCVHVDIALPRSYVCCLIDNCLCYCYITLIPLLQNVSFFGKITCAIEYHFLRILFKVYNKVLFWIYRLFYLFFYVTYMEFWVNTVCFCLSVMWQNNFYKIPTWFFFSKCIKFGTKWMHLVC